jgi:hypothetical protein
MESETAGQGGVMRGPRIVVIALLGALQLAAFITILATYERPVGEYGYTVASDGITIGSVEPGLPAERAGIVAGDRIVYRTFPVHGRLNAIQNEWVAAGRPLHLQIVRDGSVRDVTMVAVPLPALYAVVQLSFAFAGLVLAAVGLALVALRPCRMTWGFAAISPVLLLPDALMLWAHGAPPAAGYAYQVGVALIYAMQAAGIMIFASRFPGDSPGGLNRIIDRIAIPLGLAIAILYIYIDTAIWFGSNPPAHWILFTQSYIAPSVPSVAAVVALVATYVNSASDVRNRLLPTLATLVLLIVAETLQTIELSQTANPTIVLFSYFLFAAAAGFFAAAVVYGVFWHRVIDVNFFVGRTLVYTALTIFAVGTFSLIEFLFGKLLERGGVATMLEIVAAIAIGLSLNALHNRVDTTINVVLFRRRHLAEERLNRAAAALPHAASRQLVDEMLTAEPADALDLASAAVFVRQNEESDYERAAAVGWSDQNAASLGGDDHLVVRLRAELRSTTLDDLRWPRTDVPTGIAQPLYAIPVTIGPRLEAIALYGGHPGGEGLDPAERRSLRALAGAAALAYDHILMQELRHDLDRARHENSSLRHVEHTLTNLLKTRLKDGTES